MRIHPFWKVVGLLLSHVVVIIGVALWAVAHNADVLERQAFDDAWYRVGLQFSSLGETPPEGLPPFEEDLIAVAQQFPSATRPIVVLLSALRGDELEEASAVTACGMLSWRRCGVTDIRRMKASLPQGGL